MTASEIKYLLTVYELSQIGKVYSKDVAYKLGVSKVSVFGAINRFEEKGYINRKFKGELFLTKRAEILACMYFKGVEKLKFELIKAFRCNTNIAKSDAIKMISGLSEANFKKYIESTEVKLCL